MPTKIAINGFGRIGRATFKIALENKKVKIAAINDLGDTKALSHLLKFDSVYGHFHHAVDYTEKELIVDGQRYPVFHEKDPQNLPWAKKGVDVVLECTGHFREKKLASKHLEAGAKRVIISAPAKSDDVPTYVLGVNTEKKIKEKIISMASCTTNCIAPIAEILERRLDILKGLMTTIHAYTSTQNLVDGSNKDARKGRAGGINIVPTTTGAAIATAKTIPSLEKFFDGISIRVPVPVVSLADFTVLLKTKTTAQEVNKIFLEEAQTKRYRGILATVEEELVSSDFVGNPHSGIVDLNLTEVIDKDLVKVIAWYDNEWGYSNRLVELAASF